MTTTHSTNELNGITEKMISSRLDDGIRRTQAHLLSIQHDAGYWVGELEADASVTAGYIPLMYFLTGKVDPERQQKIINFTKSKQIPGAGWSTYPGGESDLSVTVQVYFALKLAGVSADESFMKDARKFVLGAGGVTKTNVITKVWLAIFGEFDWRGTPSIPPELVLLPRRSFFNIYDFSSWSRATIVALMIVLTNKPVCRVPESARIQELYVSPPGERDNIVANEGALFSWRRFFLVADRAFKVWERSPLKPGRKRSIKAAVHWIAQRQEADGSWGGIMLPWVYSLIALKSQGHSLEDALMAKGLRGIDDFIMEDHTTFRLQPATSPVWDTAWAIISLSESGIPAAHPALIKAARWLLKKEIRTGGDWQVKNSKAAPGCWAFEFHNDHYPDIDDTAVVCRALLKVRLPDAEESAKNQAIRRGLHWTVQMQSNDGGWAAFDRNNNKPFLAEIPFADFITPLDPTSPDVTAHVLELFGELGVTDTTLKNALSYVRHSQEPDGAWYGRWGVNYIYGTGLILAGLRWVKTDMEQEYVQRAARWLEIRQNQNGGWGESCATYERPEQRSNTGRSTASQTSWALLGLLAANSHPGQPIEEGVNYLLETQQENGTWPEWDYTGTGFPRTFYLKYDLYRTYFPLLALARYRTSLQQRRPT